MPRPHPFDFAFGAVADPWFGEIQAAARTGQRDALDLAQFARLPPVERMLQDMQPEGVEPERVEATEEYLRLLYAAFHFWSAGKKTLPLGREALERQLLAVAVPDNSASYDGPAYFRLPENRFWGQLAEGEPHEPIDGFFLVRGGGSGRKTEWLVLAVLGLREDRDGFSQISLTATDADFTQATAVEEPALSPAMPGGEVAGFHSVRSVADMMLLARLALISTAQ